jgi:hypothetical protein
MNSIPVCVQLQQGPVVCPRCRSAARTGPGHCLRCMLSQAIGATGKRRWMICLARSMRPDAEWHPGNHQILEEIERAKDWEPIADHLRQSGWRCSCSSEVDSIGRLLFTADAYTQDGRRFIVLSGERLSAFLELERLIGVGLRDKK